MLRKSVFSMLILSVCIHAQQLPQMRVIDTPRRLPNEFVGSQHRDVNGRIAAAVKVISDMEGFSYQSYNGIVKIEQTPGSDMVFLQPDERVLEIYKSGYEPLKVILSDYSIRLESRQVWELKVTGEKKPVNVTILSNPPDAEKILDGELLGTGETFRIVPGEHELRLRKDGYRGMSQTITVNEDNTLFRGYTLKQIDVTAVTITTTPSEADIYVNGVLRGQSYWSDFLFPEEYNLRIIKPGYLDVIETVAIKEDVQNDLVYTLVKNAAILDITARPTDARIIIHDQQYSPGRIELVPGTYTLRILQSGYLPQEEEITLRLGEIVTRNVTLVKNVGTLSLRIKPDDADVWINKTAYGGKRIIELAPGSYQLEYKRDGYFTQTENVMISQGVSVEKSIELIQQTGSLQFKVIPNNASVVMLHPSGNLYDRWEGLRLLNTVPVGSYTLEASHPDYLTERRSIEIEYDKRLSYQIQLMTYEGSIQQEIDQRVLWRNISISGSAVMGIAAGILTMVSDRNYEKYEGAETVNEAVKYYDAANTMRKVSGLCAVAAGVSFIPSLYFQWDIMGLKGKIK